MHELGHRLKVERVKKNLTQKQVAKRVNVEAPTISGYETGNVTPPIDMLIKLASVYNVSIDFLVGIELKRTILVDYLEEDQIIAIESIVEAFRKKNADDRSN